MVLRCTRCGHGCLSAFVYRGRGEHVCKSCGGPLALADPRDERRSGSDRRARGGTHDGSDWRSGRDRRESLEA